MKKWARFAALTLVLALVMGLLPTGLGPTWAAAETKNETDMEYVKYNDERQICGMLFDWPHVVMNHPIASSFVSYNTSHQTIQRMRIPIEVAWAKGDSMSGLGYDLYEKDTGRRMQISRAPSRT